MSPRSIFFLSLSSFFIVSAHLPLYMECGPIWSPLMIYLVLLNYRDLYKDIDNVIIKVFFFFYLSRPVSLCDNFKK